jgi:hypothetical protein
MDVERHSMHATSCSSDASGSGSMSPGMIWGYGRMIKNKEHQHGTWRAA